MLLGFEELVDGFLEEDVDGLVDGLALGFEEDGRVDDGFVLGRDDGRVLGLEEGRDDGLELGLEEGRDDGRLNDLDLELLLRFCACACEVNEGTS